MSDRIALVTANFGGFDLMKPLPESLRVGSFYYCDGATRSAGSPEARATWTRVVVPNYPRNDFSPRLRSRYFKHQIHRLDEVRDYRWLVWVDSSLRFKELAFIERLCSELSQRPETERLLVVPHPKRKTILEEYEYIHGKILAGSGYHTERYGSEKMTEQIAHFRMRGWRLDAPLYCGGFWIIENSDRYQRCWDDWWDQNIKFGMMDQLSLGVMVALHGLTPKRFDVSIVENEFFSLESHLTPKASLPRRVLRRLLRRAG